MRRCGHRREPDDMAMTCNLLAIVGVVADLAAGILSARGVDEFDVLSAIAGD